jgi:N-acetylmuramoyl-L-alanine amidase
MSDKRNIKFLVVHCTATSQSATVAAIQKYWREKLGWKNPGYHVIIEANGTRHRLASDATVCNGVAGQNSHSLHVSYIGGIDRQGKPQDNRTGKQKEMILDTLTVWKKIYPNAQIVGHRDFSGVRKACPSFDAKNEYKNL